MKRFQELPEGIIAHDLNKNIPYASESIDAVYHSHLLEHLDRDKAEKFLLEIKRVLKPGGVHRIVVPDLELLCKEYLNHLTAAETDDKKLQQHDHYVSALFEQAVRREASGSSEQGKLRRQLENALFGDARKRGETHQWMYDRITLKAKLLSAGYRDISVCSYTESSIPDWASYRLDQLDNGEEYVPGSIYVEARK